MARHEQLTVGQLTIESAIIDEDGNTLVEDSASISTTTSATTSNSLTPKANSVTASNLSAGNILASAISIAVASYPSEGTNLSHIVSATQSGAADATNSSSASLNSSNLASNATSTAAYDSSTVTNSSSGSLGLNWDETMSEFSSDVLAGSAIDSAGSAAFQNNPVFGQIWDQIGSAISSASA